MAEKAHVTSIEAIESFRAALVLFLSKAKPIIDGAGSEVRRTREWLRQDRVPFWENQMRRRMRDLEEAQQALFSAELSNLRAATTTEQQAVHQARRSVREAEEKLRVIKRWTRELDQQVEQMAKQVEHFRTVLTTDMPKGVAFLAHAVKTLDAYTGLNTGAIPTGAPGTGPSETLSTQGELAIGGGGVMQEESVMERKPAEADSEEAAPPSAPEERGERSDERPR